MKSKQNAVLAVLGFLLAAGSLGLYVATLSRGPFPGESAAAMAGELGLDPLWISQHPLFDALARLAAAVPLGTISYRLNLLSAACAALSLGLFFRVVRDAILFAIDVTDRNRRAAETAALVAGVSAALFLMLCPPFWYAANRFHAASFDLLMLFALARLFLSFTEDASAWKGLLLAFVYGLGAVEFATLIVFGPLLLAGVLLALWRHGELRRSRLAGLGGGLFAGLAFYFVAGWKLAASDAYSLGGGEGYWQAVYVCLKNQFNLIGRSLPQLGWMLVVVVGIVPWLAALAVGRRSLNEEKDKGLYVLHVVLAAVAVAVLFDVPFSPWRLMGASRLLVTPYALLAATYGYLTAYWLLLPRMFAQDAEPEERGRLWFRENGGWIPAGVLMLLPAIAGVLNFREADARGAGLVNAYARSVVEDATRDAAAPPAAGLPADAQATSGVPWLVTDGVLDSHLAIASFETRAPLRLFNLHLGNNAAYMTHTARSFPSARLKTLAGVDGMAFLQEWMASDPAFARHAAFLNLPDLWYADGRLPLPDRGLYRGVKALADCDPESLWKTHEAFWREPFLAQLKAAREREPLLKSLDGYLLQQSSMLADNVGVLMEDLGWRQQAYTAYAKARELSPANVSALLNQSTMLDQGFSAPDADAVKKVVKDFVAGLRQRISVWDLSRTCGYVRMPQAYADLGMSWVLSGQPGMAVAGFKKALELAPDKKSQLTQGLAMAYLAQDQTAAQGEAIYRQLLEQDPTNRTALVTLARASARQGRFEEATHLLERAEKAGVPREAVAMEYAVLHLASGDPAKARVILEELTDLKPEWTRAWAMLAAVGLQQKDEALAEKCERRLSRAPSADFLALAVLGNIALSRADYAAARIHLDQALSLRPNNLPLLDLLLRLDYQERRRDLAMQHIRSILLLDPGSPFANQVFASFQLERNEYALAEDSLRKALERGRTPSLLNDLAWVLQERGNLEEAAKLSRESLKDNEKAPTYWDTLGVILMKQGQLAEAEAALKKSVELFAGDLGVQTHLVQLCVKQGDRAKAVKLAEDLLTRDAELTASDRETLRGIARRR